MTKRRKATPYKWHGIIIDPIFHAQWCVATGPDQGLAVQHFDKVMRNIRNDYSELSVSGMSGAFSFAPDVKGGLLWFKEEVPSPEVLSHEIAHAVVHLFTVEFNHKIENASDELFAYYIGWLTKQVAKKVWR